MKMAKYIVLSVLCIGLVLTGCSKKEETPSAATAEAPQQTTETSTPAPEQPSAEVGKKATLQEIMKNAKSEKSYSYEWVTESPMGTFTTLFYTDGENMKSITKMPQGESISVTTKDKTITYDPATKMGMSYTLSETDRESIVEEQNQMSADEEEIYEVLGEETVNGYPCVILKSGVKDESDGKVWISKEYGIMIKMSAKDSESGQVIEMNCKNIKIGNIPADTFKVPSDIKIVEAGKYPVDGE